MTQPEVSEEAPWEFEQFIVTKCGETVIVEQAPTYSEVSLPILRESPYIEARESGFVIHASNGMFEYEFCGRGERADTMRCTKVGYLDRLIREVQK